MVQDQNIGSGWICKKKEVLPTFPWGKRYAMISLIDNPYEGGKNDERHGAVPEFVGDCGSLEGTVCDPREVI